MNGKRIKAFRESQREEKIYRFVDFGEIFFFVTFQETMDRFSFNGNKQIGLGLISGGGGERTNFHFSSCHTS